MHDVFKRNLINKIRVRYPNINLHDNIELERVQIHKEIFELNLEHNVSKICNMQDDGQIQTISYISLPFGELNLNFSIEILNSNYKGRYTIWCPELHGCITDGVNKKQAFNNILYAISEILVLNFFCLNNNPLSSPITPLPTHSFINFPNTSFLHHIENFIPLFSNDHNYNNLYVGKKHIIFRDNNIDSQNITILYDGITDLTKFCIEQII
jgi:hypothetical protein